jgi:hypothetical protein
MVEEHCLPFPETQEVLNIQSTFIDLIVFGEYVLETLWLKAPFVVVSHRITPMLVLVQLVDVDMAEWVRKVAWQYRMGEVKVYNQRYK